MTIEEAIEHCKEVATENRQYALEFARVNVYDSARNCQECAAKHEQLAEWLTELKQRRASEQKQPKSNADRIRQMTDEELADILRCNQCIYLEMPECERNDCKYGILAWLKQEVSEDAGTD